MKIIYIYEIVNASFHDIYKSPRTLIGHLNIQGFQRFCLSIKFHLHLLQYIMKCNFHLHKMKFDLDKWN
jgi:hypothetical protein